MGRLTRRRVPTGTGSSSRIIGGVIALFGLLIIVFSAAAPWYTLDVEIADRPGDWRNTHYAVDGFGDVTVSATAGRVDLTDLRNLERAQEREIGGSPGPAW